jgi:hypothetical protein
MEDPVQLKRILAAASLVLLTSCDSATGVVNLGGLVTFTYSGGISGNYSANGQMPASNAAQETSSWAAAEVSAPSGAVFSYAASPRNATSHDFVDLTIARTTVGTSNVDPGCFLNCTGLYVVFGAPNTGAGSSFLQECWFESGSVTITEISATRVKGTFSGTGKCFSYLGAETSFTVTNGAFDMAVLPDVT